MTEPTKKVDKHKLVGWEKENWAFELPLKHITKIKSLLETKEAETEKRIIELCEKERDAIAPTPHDFDQLNDPYDQGYWMAMNTVIKKLEKMY